MSLSLQERKDALLMIQNQQCIYCNNKMSANHHDRDADNHATKEHILPRSEGGGNELFNIVLACRKCNNARGSNTLSPEFLLKCRYVTLAMHAYALTIEKTLTNSRAKRKIFHAFKRKDEGRLDL